MLVIATGVLSLVAQLPAIPKPGWFVELSKTAQEPGATMKLRLDDTAGKPLRDTAEDRGKLTEGH